MSGRVAHYLATLPLCHSVLIFHIDRKVIVITCANDNVFVARFKARRRKGIGVFGWIEAFFVFGSFRHFESFVPTAIGLGKSNRQLFAHIILEVVATLATRGCTRI